MKKVFNTIGNAIVEFIKEAPRAAAYAINH